MKTLFLVAKGLSKDSDDVIQEMERKDLHPRVSLLEKELNTQLLDERYLKTVPSIRRWFYKLLPVEFVQLIEAWIVHDRYDVIVSYYERVGLPFALLQKIMGSTTPHVLITTWFSSPKKSWFLKRVHNSLAKIITWSSNQYKYALNELCISPAKIKLIKRGTDQKFWRPLDVETDMICSAGMEMRDYPTLVEALRLLDIPCHIAASPEARGQKYETVGKLHSIKELPSNVTVGKKKYPELRQLYARSRFVVVSLLPTDTDNGLTVILEAMAMGKPVICSKTRGQIDVIEHGVTGIYVPQGDPVALRKAIVKLWKNPKKAEEMGKAARKYIEEVHNLEQFVSAIKKEAQKAVAATSKIRRFNKSKAKADVEG